MHWPGTLHSVIFLDHRFVLVLRDVPLVVGRIWDGRHECSGYCSRKVAEKMVTSEVGQETLFGKHRRDIIACVKY